MKLAHTMIRVKDLDATLEFYTGFLGLAETRRRPIGDEATLIFLEDDAGAYQIELTVNHGKSDYDLGDQFGHLGAAVIEVAAHGADHPDLAASRQ